MPETPARDPLYSTARPLTHDHWAHRSTTMRCSTCMWFVLKSAPEDVSVAIGRCRRHAPNPAGGGVGWPVVFPADWCGDHRLDETKL